MLFLKSPAAARLRKRCPLSSLSLACALLFAPVLLPWPRAADHQAGGLHAQNPTDNNLSFDELARRRREAFLKAREEMRTLPLPSPTPGSRPVVKPTPASPPNDVEDTPAAASPPPPAPTATPTRPARVTPAPAATPQTGDNSTQPDASVVIRKGATLPFTESGTVAPKGYEDEYFVDQTEAHLPVYSSFRPDSFGNDVLPGRFGEIGRGAY